jgi:hypothetical protein
MISWFILQTKSDEEAIETAVGLTQSACSMPSVEAGVPVAGHG